MPSENSTERKCVKLTTQKVAAAGGGGGEMPPEPEQLQCPRCDSHNTKFCYYNNYNFSQPRHFCKSCRRYWTKGGTLRDIPIGGGSRKNAKRSRVATSNNYTTANTTISSFPFSSTTTTTSSSATSRPITSQFLGPISGERGVAPLSFWADAKASGVNLCGSFTSLLNTHGPGFFAVGGFGGGLEDVGFGMGRAVWPFPGVGFGETGGFNGGHWHLQSGETIGGINAAANGECFTLSDVNLSTPRFD